MACTRCGECCKQVVIVHKRDQNLARYFALHGLDVLATERGMDLVIDKPCLSYDAEAGACRIYEARPDICRRFLCEKAREVAVA
jgi:Fe-S-cluster containining protein